MNMALLSVNPSVLVYFSAFVVIPLILYAVFCYERFVVSEQSETAETLSQKIEIYAQTVAIIKSRNRLFRKSSLQYNVDGQEFSITVPYYIESDSTDIIYLKDEPNKAILYDCERLKKTVKKYTVLANLSLISEFVMIVLTILMFVLLVNSGGLH